MQSEGWVFRVKAYNGESLGHFLGRFRRANQLSHKAIADHLGIRVEWVMAWEAPSRRRNPTPLQLIALSKLVDVEPKQSRENATARATASANKIYVQRAMLRCPCIERHGRERKRIDAIAISYSC